MHIYEIRSRADKCGVDVISDALPFSPVWYAGQTQSAMQLVTQSFAAVRTPL